MSLELIFERLYDPLLTRKPEGDYTYEKLCEKRNNGCSGFADEYLKTCQEELGRINEMYKKQLDEDKKLCVNMNESLFGCLLHTPNFEIVEVNTYCTQLTYSMNFSKTITMLI